MALCSVRTVHTSRSLDPPVPAECSNLHSPVSFRWYRCYRMRCLPDACHSSASRVQLTSPRLQQDSSCYSPCQFHRPRSLARFEVLHCESFERVAAVLRFAFLFVYLSCFLPTYPFLPAYPTANLTGTACSERVLNFLRCVVLSTPPHRLIGYAVYHRQSGP